MRLWVPTSPPSTLPSSGNRGSCCKLPTLKHTEGELVRPTPLPYLLTIKQKRASEKLTTSHTTDYLQSPSAAIKTMAEHLTTPHTYTKYKQSYSPDPPHPTSLPSTYYSRPFIQLTLESFNLQPLQTTVLEKETYLPTYSLRLQRTHDQSPCNPRTFHIQLLLPHSNMIHSRLQSYNQSYSQPHLHHSFIPRPHTLIQSNKPATRRPWTYILPPIPSDRREPWDRLYDRRE